MTAVIITTAGLALDVLGAFLIAIEVFRVFRGPTTIDGGDSGTINGGFIAKVNPEFEAHETRKRRIMTVGLVLLLAGISLQGLGAWWLVAFEKPAAVSPDLDKRLSQIESQVDKVRSERQQRRAAIVDCANSTFKTVDSNIGWFLVSCERATPFLNGFKIRLEVGNPSSLTYNGIRVDVKSLTAEDPAPEGNSKISADIHPGTWSKAEVTLVPAKAEDIRFLVVAITANEVSLRTR